MRRPRPHQIVFAIGVFAAVFTTASGIAPALTHWHHASPIEREAFSNVPTALKVAFYASVSVMLLIVASVLRTWDIVFRAARVVTST